MTNYILGKDLLDRWNIKPFELFHHVKDGLQPHNKYGKPISPPDIVTKLKRLNDLKNELGSDRFSWLRLSPERKKSLVESGRVKRDPAILFSLLGESGRWEAKYEEITRDIKIIENELAKIENKYSWGEYELSEATNEAEWVINSLLNPITS